MITLSPERSRRANLIVLFVTVAALGMHTPSAQPQGCAQCRDAVAQTPARTQTAYRRAIILMVAAGCTVFTGAIVTLRRFR